MPAGLEVTLVPHDPQWAAKAASESRRLSQALGSIVLQVHHIGSTAVPGIVAKPTLDLMPVVAFIEVLDERRREIEQLGYEWRGEFGLPGRRYCVLSEIATGRRLVHLHFFAEGSRDVERHLAFRDYLRARPEVAAMYEREKQRCCHAHPVDSGSYTDCKNAWIRAVEADALEWRRGRCR